MSAKPVISLVEGDITSLDVSALVNPSNRSLILGGGLSGTIARLGGKSIQEEMEKIGGCNVGSAVITSAGSLKAEYVIHAVGPVMGDGDEGRKIADATTASLLLAEKYQIDSIAFPAISTGIFSVPIEISAEAMIGATKAFCKETDGGSLKEVILCLYNREAFEIFNKTLGEM